MTSNLPTTTASTTDNVNKFFNGLYEHEMTFPSNQIDATVGFFLKRDFDLESARSTAIVLLTQARVDNVNVFELLDTMKTLNNIQLSQIVTQVLNASREKTSFLGYRVEATSSTYDLRNIVV